jgi:hypothetical protein
MYNRDHQISGIWPVFGHAQARSRGIEDAWAVGYTGSGTRPRRHGELDVRQAMKYVSIDNY